MKKTERLEKLINKYLQGENTREELGEIFMLLRDDNEFRLNSELERILEAHWNSGDFRLPAEEAKGDLGAVLERIRQQISPDLKSIRQKKVRSLMVNISKVAAVLAIGIILGLMPGINGRNKELLNTFIAPNGSVAQMVLPDSTLVFLNSGTELRYDQAATGRKREVFLNGEAWFSVTENRNRPFVVHTPYYDLRVTGTEFNVKAYKGDRTIVTTLEEGEVCIPSTDRFKIGSDRNLLPGQQLVYDRESNTVATGTVKPGYYSSWKDNKLIFINMSVKELVILLERKYGVDISVMNPSILNYHYDGTIKNEGILEIMELLRKTLPIAYQVNGQTIQVSSNN